MARVKYLALANPILAATFPVSFLYARNIDEVTFATAAVALLVVLAGAVLFFLVVGLLVRDVVKGGLITAIWLLLFFSYEAVLELVDGVSIAGFELGRQRYLLVAELLVAVFVLWSVVRARSLPYRLTPYLGAGLVVALAINLAVIIPNKLGPSSGGSATLDLSPAVTAPRISPEELPDIYYIILDSYPRKDVLQKVYGFDNQEFLDYLARKGFFVASDSRSNYIATSLSMSSSLNMVHVADLLKEELNPGSKNQMVLLPAIQDNRAVQFAKAMGYRFAFIRSLSPLFISNPQADVKLTPQVYPFQKFTEFFINPVMGNPFGSSLLRSTALRGFVDQWLGTTWVRVFRETMAQLKSIPQLDGPMFTFAHVYPPHPPYVFDRNGNERNIPYKFPDSWADKESYVEQLVWVNRSMEQVIDEILDQSQDRAVIVIQGDHGSSTSDAGKVLYYGGGEPDGTLIFERIGILNAYHLPETCDSRLLYHSITPVNSFRVVFDSCFGTTFGLADDQTYWSTYNRPYDLSPVEGLDNYTEGYLEK